MTAGTVVITGGILATVILLVIIAVLCYCRLQVGVCERDIKPQNHYSLCSLIYCHNIPLSVSLPLPLCLSVLLL